MSDAFLESGGLLPTPGSGVDFGFESRFSKLSLGQPRPGGSTTAQLTPEKQQALKDQLEKPSKVPSRLTMLLKQFRRRVRVWKRSYFNFVTGLLAESNGSVAAIVVSAVEFLQMIALCFHDIDWGPHGNAFGSAIEFSLIEEPVVERHGYLYSYILVGIYLFYIYVFAVLGAYLLKSHVNNNFNIGLWPMRALRIKTFMADSVLFIPITFTFFNLYECQWGDCSTSKQIEILLAVICTPALFIHFAGAYLNAFTVYQSNPVSLDVEARSESFVKVLQITQRLFVVAAFVYSNYIPIFKSTTSLIFAVIMSSYLVVFIPYYSRLFNILSFIFSNVIAWASLFGVVQQVYVFIQPDHNHAAQDYIFYAFLASIPLIAVGSYYIFQQRYIFATSFKTASDNFGVAEASKNNFNTWEIEEIEVTKKKDARFWHPSQVELATRFLIENSDPQAVDLAEQIFLAGVQKFPNSSWLMLQYSIYFLVFKKDKSMALNYISKAKARGLPLTLQVLAYMQRQDSRYTNAMNKKVATVDRVEFKQLMKAAANNHRDAKASIANFWQTILQAEEDKPVDTSILINLVAQMERCDDRATVAYRQILQKFPLSVRVLQSYAVFLDEIHNNLIEAEEVRKKIKKIQDAGMSDEFVGAGDVKTGVLTVKTKKERQGYKEYRKQVYLYSRANSMMMHSMIRAVLLLFVIVGICQLLIIQIGLSTIRNEIHWLHTLDQCSDSFPIIHTTLRSIQASNPFPSPESLNASTASVQKLLTGISENTTLLFDRLSNRRSTYVMWGQPRVMVDLFHGDVLSPNRSTLMLSLRDATLLYLRHSKASVEAVTAVGADPTVVFGSNAWRFVLDNGMVVLANAFTDVSRIIAHDIRFNLQLLGYAELAVWGFGILTILLSAFFVFAPMINKARRERETSLRAFLQIPKSVTHNPLCALL
ncbi:hypothetical protein BC829DRAFT_202522 [Chytridium lagenaria]|nr:hypothetical protein BC829DRAFT_202522 [Chytridium lagenaria]